MSDETPTSELLDGFVDTLRTLAKDAESREAAQAFLWVLGSYGDDVARLRAEVERLTTRAEQAEAAFARAVAEQGIIADDRDSALTSYELACEREGRLRVEVERLTRERDAAQYASREAWARVEFCDRADDMRPEDERP